MIPSPAVMKKFFDFSRRHQYPLLIGLSFCVWIWCFRGFLLARFGVTSDASAYVTHVKFLTSNLARGIYPMWEFGTQTGLPAEFFLRRIGSYNPIYGPMALLQALGVPFYPLYLGYLAVYYFTGMLGFYLLARRIFSEPLYAFIAFLFLTFSSWGTRLFDSYIYLTLVPLIWFFYFLLSFARQMNRKNLLGAVFALMILFTTYIPFYFFGIATTFIVVWLIFYYSQLPRLWTDGARFLRNNRVFTGFCAGLLLVSLLPGGMFFAKSASNELVIGQRSSAVLPDKGDDGERRPAHFLEVGFETITSWGIEEDLMYSWAFPDMRYFKFAVVYFPVLLVCLFLAGLFSGVSRVWFFLMVWGTVVFLIFAHRFSVYPFLFEKVVFFKYFRNLHFYLWLVLMPVVVLLSVEQFRLLLSRRRDTFPAKAAAGLWVAAVHLGLLYWLGTVSRVIETTFIVVLASLLVCLWGVFRPGARHKAVFAVALFLLAVVQPVQSYHYLVENSGTRLDPETLKWYKDYPFLRFSLPRESTVTEQLAVRAQDLPPRSAPDFYFSLRRHLDLARTLKYEFYLHYLSFPFYVYDFVEAMPETRMDPARINTAFSRLENTAFVEVVSDDDRSRMAPDRTGRPHIAYEEMEQFVIRGFDANYITLTTNFDKDKFLVFNDGYDSDWQVFINGVRAPLRRANIAFKGVWVPPGENTVLFRFGRDWQYVMNYGLLALFHGIFIYLVYLHFRERRKNGQPV
jgi:hypothetical protein